MDREKLFRAVKFTVKFVRNALARVGARIGRDREVFYAVADARPGIAAGS